MPPEATRPLVAIVLAAQRDGLIDPLAAGAGVTHKCLVPIGGKVLIAHVIDALQATPRIERIRIVVEPAVVAQSSLTSRPATCRSNTSQRRATSSTVSMPRRRTWTSPPS